MTENLGWRVGNGNSVKFWTDPWVPNFRCLKELSSIPLSAFEEGESVSQFVTGSGQWDFSRFRNKIPTQVMKRIEAILPPNELYEEDFIA